MIPIPAVDVAEGRAVRLLRGAREKKIDYGDPLEFAHVFAASGARRLHLVDLDGAFEPEAPDSAPKAPDSAPKAPPAGSAGKTGEILARIVKETGLAVEVGGGLRSAEAVARAFEAGAAYVVLGTLAARDVEAAGAIAQAYPGRVYFGLDVRGDRAAVVGWTEEGRPWPALLTAWRGLPIRGLIVTAIERDGTLEGPDLDLLRAVAEASEVPVIASGGVSSLEDLRDLAALSRRLPRPLEGVILGKALYEKKFDFAAAREALGCEAVDDERRSTRRP